MSGIVNAISRKATVNEAVPVESLATSLRRIYLHLTPRRQRQLGLTLVLMLIGAIAELATVGAVLPFLALIADPRGASSYPLLQNIFSAFAWRDANDIVVPAT
jgi:hypothetical protein